MKVLTLIQPWATAIVHHGKNIENRPWAPHKALIGQRFAIHAGMKVDKVDTWNLMSELPGVDLNTVPTGAILGTVQLVGYIAFKWAETARGPAATYEWFGPIEEAEASELASSKWVAKGTKFAWVLSDPMALETPLPCKGSLGLWTAPEIIATQAVTSQPPTTP